MRIEAGLFFVARYILGRIECSGVIGRKNNTFAVSEANYSNLQLTEYVLIVGACAVADMMHKLAKLGSHFSIDTLGTS